MPAIPESEKRYRVVRVNPDGTRGVMKETDNATSAKKSLAYHNAARNRYAAQYAGWEGITYHIEMTNLSPWVEVIIE